MTSLHTMPPSAQTVGMDIGDRTSKLAILDADGTVVSRETIANTRQHIAARFASLRGSRVAIEIGTQTRWIAEVLERLGCEVIVANARQLHLISRSLKKTDTNDAVLLARMARSDPELLRPIRLRGPQTASDRTRMGARDKLVECRKRLVNFVRSSCKQTGMRLRSCKACDFVRLARDDIPDELLDTLQGVLSTIEHLDVDIARCERTLERIAKERYPETEMLRQPRGVGLLTALAFVLAIEDPERFTRSRDVGPYLGLTPRLFESGTSTAQLGITKSGDRMARRLLVGAAQYMLGRNGEDSDLRRFGLALAERGGKNAKKRAVVAVARKLAVRLHALWISKATYEPFRSSPNGNNNGKASAGRSQQKTTRSNCGG